jgi:hypothetical protein
LIEQQGNTHREAGISHVEDAGAGISDAEVLWKRKDVGSLFVFSTTLGEAPYFLGRFFTKFQKPRGSVIVKPPTSPATSSKSLSPVTNTSALAANTDARTH